MPTPLPPHSDFAKPPAAPGENRPIPLQISPDDWTRQQSELQSLRAIKAERDKEAAAAEQAKIKLMAEKGQIEEAFKLQKESFDKKLSEYQTQAKSIETEWLGERRNTAIGDALSGKTFAGENPQATAALVRKLLESEVEAVRDHEGKPVIRDRQTLRPAAEYLQERLNSPDFALFFKATNRGGAGTDGARPSAAHNNPAGDPFDVFAKEFVDRQKAYQNTQYLRNS